MNATPQPLVSIIVPVYNVEPWLRRCVDSLLQQTYTQIEVILVNDGSTDRGAEICAEYQQQDARVRFIDQANAGVSVARNRGLAAATGEFVLFVDSDDYLDDRLDALMARADVRRADLTIYGVVQLLGNGQSVTHTPPLFSGDFAEIRDDVISYHNEGMTVNSSCNKLFRREILREHHLEFPPGVRFGEDAMFNVTYFHFVRTACFCDTCLYVYDYTRAGSACKKPYDNYYRDNARLIEVMDDYITSRCRLNPAQQQAWSTRRLQIVLNCAYGYLRSDLPFRTKYRWVKQIIEAEHRNAASRPGSGSPRGGGLLGTLFRQRQALLLCLAFRPAALYLKLRDRS